MAVAGEWMRTRAGLGDSLPWIEASLERQVDLFTPWGMYRDPNDPMAYDHFARLWALDLLDEGYQGRHAAALETLVERGAWMSMFMQSPWGELPCGGRSAHHQWNEAQQAVTFESWAARFARRGDRAAAGACRRAAHLSLQSIGRWVRPTGELWIVKNRMDPAARHGYESYSFHSQYNLLAAAMLAIAWTRADDGIPEAPCPADTGGFAFALQPAFHKVVRQCRRHVSRIRYRGRPPLQPDGPAPGPPPGRASGNALRRRERGRGVPPAVHAHAVRWRWARSGATAPAPGMRWRTTAGTTSTRPSSCSCRRQPGGSSSG